eukprot:9196630-Karenia_brevis.AAC.1
MFGAYKKHPRVTLFLHASAASAAINVRKAATQRADEQPNPRSCASGQIERTCREVPTTDLHMTQVVTQASAHSMHV